MERILVTGAAGYIGSHVVNVLLDMGYAVVAADLDLDNVDDRAEKCYCNIFNEEDLYVKFGEPDVLIHMAWRNGFVHNGMRGTRRACELVDVETLITKLYLSGKLTDEQLQVMKEFGDKRRAPHQYIWRENRAADQWRRAMDAIQIAATERGWIE